jgi:hypothetical protein
VFGIFRRALASVAAWTLGAGIAVGVGVISLSLIDNGLASGAGHPMSTDSPPRPAGGAATATGSDDPSPDAVSDSPSPSPSPSARPAAAAASPTPGAPRQFTSTGGTVLARCTGNQAYLVSWSPAQDYRADDVHRGPARTVWVKFENGPQVVVLAVHCVAGMPQPISHWDE